MLPCSQIQACLSNPTQPLLELCHLPMKLFTLSVKLVKKLHFPAFYTCPVGFIFFYKMNFCFLHIEINLFPHKKKSFVFSFCAALRSCCVALQTLATHYILHTCIHTRTYIHRYTYIHAPIYEDIQGGARNVIPFYYPIRIVTSKYRCCKRASECCSSRKMR